MTQSKVQDLSSVEARGGALRMPRLIIGIPARMGSTRLPGKPLRTLGGVPIIQRVVERTRQLALWLEDRQRDSGNSSQCFDCMTVVVATDDERIAAVVREAGYVAILTPADLPSGTDRVFWALREGIEIDDDDVIINIQGDEPFFDVEAVGELALVMQTRPEIPLATLAFRRHSTDLFFTSSVVKVVLGEGNRALYFSRAPIPWPRTQLGAGGRDWMTTFADSASCQSTSIAFWHHVGVYAFRWNTLRAFSQELPRGGLEDVEGLEQLRALQAGWEIAVQGTLHDPLGIDTESDLEAAENRLQQGGV